MARFSKKINRRRTKRQQKKSRQGKRKSFKFLLSNLFKGGVSNDTVVPTQNVGVRKNILLIIDPQNDFSDIKEPYRSAPGSLAVTGASGDYERIIKFIQNSQETIDEIHVSLDTHTERHIGHPGFWDVMNEDGITQTNATDDIGFSILSIDKANKITGYNIFDGKTRTFVPRKYDEDSYEALCKYVYDYLRFYEKDENGNFLPENKHTQQAWIWKNHCLESSEGHKVAAELQTALDEFAKKDGKVVRYHIKGQNNLAEMYSIFSAERPVPEDLQTTLATYTYTGANSGKTYETTGATTYADAMNSLNLETGKNITLMNQLLGTNNRVFICGEAKTHCVKSSTVDLIEYAKENGVDGERIVLLANMSSVIPGVPDNIEEIVTNNKYMVLKPDDAYKIFSNSEINKSIYQYKKQQQQQIQ